MSNSSVTTGHPPPFITTDPPQPEDWKKGQRSSRYHANTTNSEQESHGSQSTSTSLIGSPPAPFKIDSSTKLEDWKKWQISFRYYAHAINLDQKSHDVQLSTFKSVVGPDAMEIYNTFSILDITDVESVMRKFNDHFKPKVNVTLERYKLYKLHQKSGQKFDDYLADVTNQAERCEFNSMRDEIVLYKIVGGIDNDEVRNALLADADLKFERAVEICRASSEIQRVMSGKENARKSVPKVSISLDESPDNNAAISEQPKDDSSDGDSDWRADSDDGDDDDYKPVVESVSKKLRSKRAAVWKNRKTSEAASKVETFTCDVCGRTIGSKKDLKRHVMTHSKVEKVTCHYCGGRYKLKRYLLRHIVRSHPGVLDSVPPQMYECDVCGYKTNQRANMHRHKYQHTEEKPYSCELCQYKCIVPRLMKAHMAKHTGERPFACSVCHKGFVEQSMLKKHMVTHMSAEEKEKHLAEERRTSRPVESTATCETCGKVFSSRGALKTHLVVHTGERPFACTICDYRAGQKAALNAHMAKHSEEKPFVCTVCGYSCKLRRTLQTHMHTHTGDRPYACKMCDSKFKQLAHLTVHVRTHTGEKPYVCDICGHRWAKQSNLTAHMKVHQNQTGDPSQYTPPRKRQKKRKAEPPPAEPAAVEPAPANAIPQWSEQVSTINPMECFLNLETPPPFHPTYPAPQGNPRPPDCRYFQQRQ